MVETVAVSEDVIRETRARIAALANTARALQESMGAANGALSARWQGAGAECFAQRHRLA